MATSEKGHYVRFDEALIDAQDFVDTGIARRALSNLDHLADQYAQTLCRWVSYDLDQALTPTGAFHDDAPDVIDADTWYRLWTSPAFDLPIRKSLHETYRCRLQMRTGVGGAPESTGTTRFLASLAPLGMTPVEHVSPGANVADATLTGLPSPNHDWRAASSLIYLDDAQMRRASRAVSAIDAVGGVAVSATWLRVQLVVYGYASDTVTVGEHSTIPVLSGVDLRAYLHP